MSAEPLVSTEQCTGTTWPRPQSRVRLDESAPQAGVRVLGVAGEIDRPEAEAILDRLVVLLRAPDAQLVVLDLSAVRFMGSHGLTAVVHAQRRAAALGRTLRGVTGAANRAVSRPITMTGLDWVIDWFPALPEATVLKRP
ncbi:MAG: STAS domain-containing protein [Pseudonocardia sp.]|nr:STAS domain-containing protein [Pseudonocardia sp.]